MPGRRDLFLNKGIYHVYKRIMDMFGNDAHQYQAFVENQADYQRSLEDLKYIEKWEF